MHRRLRRLHRVALAAWLALAAMIGVQAGVGELVWHGAEPAGCEACAHGADAAADLDADLTAGLAVDPAVDPADEPADEPADGHSGRDDACPDGDCPPGCGLCVCCPATVTVLGTLAPLPAPPAVPADLPVRAVDAAPARAPSGVFRPPRIRV